MLEFKLLQPLHQLVELEVGDLRVIEHVVAVLVVTDFVAQLGNFRVDVFGHSLPLVPMRSLLKGLPIITWVRPRSVHLQGKIDKEKLSLMFLISGFGEEGEDAHIWVVKGDDAPIQFIGFLGDRFGCTSSTEFSFVPY